MGDKPYRVEKDEFTKAWAVYSPKGEVVELATYKFEALGLAEQLNDAYSAGVEAEKTVHAEHITRLKAEDGPRDTDYGCNNPETCNWHGKRI